MACQEIRYEVAGRIATVTLNRPERLNAWTGTMGGEVRDAMRKAADDDAVNVADGAPACLGGRLPGVFATGLM